MPINRLSTQSFAEGTALVGRERERARLRELLDAALAGQGSLVLISGEAGIGKTTLVNDLLATARDKGCLVLTGGCYDLATTPPYGPWVEITRAYPTPDDRLPEMPEQLREGTSLAGIGSQTELFELVSDFFVEVSASKPLILVLEDLHWSDPASLELLRHVSRTLAGNRILLIAAYRDDEIDRSHALFRLLPLLVREGRATRLDLLPLDAAAMDALLQAHYNLPGSERDRLAKTLLERADGNPLFVEEMLRTIERQGLLRQTGDGWHLDALSEIDVPPLVVQVIEARLVGITDATRSALDIAAVIGQEFPFDTWQELVAPATEMVSIVREATAARIIENTTSGSSMRFHHALVRQALYDNLLLPQRREMHRHVAETLIAAGNPEPNAVAHHLEQAGDERAADWLIRAGGRAERLYAPLVALEIYERALNALERFPERDRERGWLMHRVARLYRWHDPGKSLPYLRQAIELAQRIDDRTLEAYTRFDAGLIQRFLGNVPDSLDQMIAAVEMIDALPPEERERSAASISPLFAEAIPDNTQSGYAAVTMPGIAPTVNLRKHTLSWLLAGCGRFDEAEAMASSMIQELHDADIGRERILALATDAFRALGVVHAVQGQPEDASYHFQISREAATAKDDHQWVAVSALLELLLVNLTFETEHVDQRKVLESVIQRTFANVPEIRPWFDATSADDMQLLLINGDWQAARALAMRYLDEAPPRPPLAEQGRALLVLATLAQRQGKLDESKQWIARLFPHGPSTLPDTPLFFVHERAQRVAIEVALDEGDVDAAAGWLDAHEAWLDGINCVIGRPETDLLRARLLLLSSDPGAAREQAIVARDRASSPRQPRVLLAIDRFLGELELAQGNVEQARTHVERSVALAERCELPNELALSQLAYAEVLAATADHRAARAILDDLTPSLEALEARPAIERAGALATRISRALRHQDLPAGLSERELEVLEHVAEGMTNAEAGEALFISPRTVAQHLRSVYNKLGVNSRAAAVARWSELIHDDGRDGTNG